MILANAVTKLQFKRIAKETGIYGWERYLDQETNPDWEQKGLDWILSEKDPDK